MATSTPSDVDQAFWSSEYSRIAGILDLDLRRDQRATELIHSSFSGREEELGWLIERLMNLLGDRLVLILGCGPRLDDQLADMVPILEVVQVPKIAADGATSALVDLGLRPDVIVTDLDGHVPDISACSRKGTIIVLHAHGDNLEAVKRWLPSLRNVLPVTQTKPTSIVRNYGGFTDGDKCLFLASAFGATGVILVGMDFGSTIGPRSDPARIKQHAIQSKLAKLDIGKRLSQTVLQSTDLRAYSLGPTPFMGVQEIQTDAIPRLLRGKR